LSNGREHITNRPIGSERLNTNGYTDIKIAYPNVWRPKHHVVWEAANGPIPEGYFVIFADRDRLNFDVDNLVLVSKGELYLMNLHGLIFPDKELTKNGKAIAALKLSISRREREAKQSGGEAAKKRSGHAV
jgi:hypothetical protein